MAYIEKHKLMSRIETESLRWGEEYDLSQIMGDIEDFPEADVAEVVRCKDCSEWDENKKECSHWYGFKENDFCSHGVRKDDENENN